ncbi:hypothetical protein GCM10010399_01820 [Dactylosporangium fulvum]|uniref:Nuclear transport factor 2 family protein n=1 Tax=Dactylosporangium fulvum TaxID=53359 RepID=A0ABY5VTC4_9ACTN|nr:nuclear transport factor 2 family protein [Dactylosporangium fulvum]UWP79738.1 nuclear transport factor 2 family protein [Dactylosporangium fulvum]
MNHIEWIERYRTAWLTKDADAAASLFTADGVYLSSPTKPPHVGSAAIAAYWRKATATQRDLELRFGRPVVDGRRVVVEWWATMVDPEWKPEADNPQVTLPGCLILRFDDAGRCEELREYYNPAFAETQPPPAGWGL